MSFESAQTWIAEHAPDLQLIDHGVSTATVAEAAAALGVAPARIAKTIALRVGDAVMLVVARGDARIDNAKTKARFGGRPRMLDAEEAFAVTGHRVGGVCPFGLATPVPVWCDVSIRGLCDRVSGSGIADQLCRNRAGTPGGPCRARLDRRMQVAGITVHFVSN